VGGKRFVVKFAENGFGWEVGLTNFFDDDGDGFEFSQGNFDNLAGLKRFFRGISEDAGGFASAKKFSRNHLVVHESIIA